MMPEQEWYGLEITTSEMEPRYRPGDTLIVSRELPDDRDEIVVWSEGKPPILTLYCEMTKDQLPPDAIVHTVMGFYRSLT